LPDVLLTVPPAPTAAEAATSDARAAFLWACQLDVVVRKPGNVSIDSPGHGMRAEDFIASAEAAMDPLFARDVRVGVRIERAIERTRDAVACNTNLGIVLLCAPLAAALEHLATPPNLIRWRHALEGVLAALDIEDARAAYRAIGSARPAGLGRAAAQDVTNEPTIGLRAAMQLAADRDSIAGQYGNGFVQVFDFGVPVFMRAATPPRVAMLLTYLAFLSRWPDSHIVRRRGLALAQTVTNRAADWYSACCARPEMIDDATVARWDAALKSEGVNPGTSADLAVAVAFVAATIDPSVRHSDLGRLA